MKFRIWDKLNNEFWFSDDFLRFHTADKANNFEDVREHIEGLETLLDAQDCKKKSLWKGDIVKVPADYAGDTYCKEYIAVIKYETCEFYLARVDEKDCITQDLVWNEVEKIGNIHQNPELLIIEPEKKVPIAYDLGYKACDLSSEILASLLATEERRELFYNLESDITKIFEGEMK